MSATVHLIGGTMGHISVTAERDIADHIRLHLRNNARCDSAIATMSEAEAWAIVDALASVLPPRAQGGAT